MPSFLIQQCFNLCIGITAEKGWGQHNILNVMSNLNHYIDGSD